MKIHQTALPGVLLIKPAIYRDLRGAFWETWNQRELADAGLPSVWVQDNVSVSKKNVVRGIHYQIIQSQGKLVRVAQGAVLDVAVDLRRSSAAFGRHVAVELTAESGEMLYIPEGFGHGFLALTENVGLTYKVTDYYCGPGERSILWSDPALGIHWPIEPEDAILSDKDRDGVLLRDAKVFP
jgi:dTDP-4-dehydrorhamnose 3,5-epimerase